MPNPLLTSAERALHTGDAKQAAALCQQALLQDSNDAAAYCLMAQIAVALGKLDNAARYIDKAIEFSPETPLYHEWRGKILAAAGQKQPAGEAYMRAATLVCMQPPERRDSRWTMIACQCLEQALVYIPGHREALLALGNLYLQEHQREQALRCFTALLAKEPRNRDALLGAAWASAGLNAYQQAMGYCTKLFATKDAPFQAYLLKAILLERMNALEALEPFLNELQSLFPNQPEWRYVLAKQENRKGNTAAARKHLEQLVAANVPFSRDPWVVHELAKILEKEKCYDQAFALFSQVNQAEAAKAVQNGLTTAAIDTRIRQAKAWYSTEAAQHLTFHHARFQQENDPRAPIFLVGFPRSGTTLLEQMLSAHPHLVATQEIDLVHQLIEALPSIIGRPCAYPEALSSLQEDEIARVRAKYWEEMAVVLGDAARQKRVVHKMPLDMVFLDFIHAIFPEAPILVMRRDPRDVVLSCFQQLFGLNPAMLHFTDLAQTAVFYREVMELYALLRRCLPLHLHEISYESLARAPEPVLRKILDFIGEPWDDALLTYYQQDHNRHVITPSYEGVMRPVYDSSTGRWKAYEKHLAKVLPVLEPFVGGA